MVENYVYITGQDGETYEICPTDGLLDFLQRLAEEEEQKVAIGEHGQDSRASAGELSCVAYQNK
jgi:hypothetical protein